MLIMRKLAGYSRTTEMSKFGLHEGIGMSTPELIIKDKGQVEREQYNSNIM